MGGRSCLPPSLLDLLSNPLILHQICPYLPISGLISLGATSKQFQNLIYYTPGVFRYLDLSTCKGAGVVIAPIDAGGEIWRSERMDESVTEEEFYSGPLRGIFSFFKRKRVLQDVHTLILDGLSVTAELVREIICDEPFNVRILSIRQAKNMNERKLQQVLRYIVRPSRPPSTPRLQGLYIFASVPIYISQAHAEWGWGLKVNSSMTWPDSTSDLWYSPWHELPSTKMQEWSDTISVCQGTIHFDAVLCRGPKHDEKMTKDPIEFLLPKSATIPLGPNGCQVCQSAPEGVAELGVSPSECLPLLHPPPLHSSSISVAQMLPVKFAHRKNQRFLARCITCVRNRRCKLCSRFWCESCYAAPTANYTPTTAVDKDGHENQLLMGLKVCLTPYKKSLYSPKSVFQLFFL
jgi:hypothetical protein